MANTGPKIHKVDMNTHEKAVCTTVTKEIFLKCCTEVLKGINVGFFPLVQLGVIANTRRPDIFFHKKRRLILRFQPLA